MKENVVICCKETQDPLFPVETDPTVLTRENVFFVILHDTICCSELHVDQYVVDPELLQHKKWNNGD